MSDDKNIKDAVGEIMSLVASGDTTSDVVEEEGGLDFICPNCGPISQKDVLFLCNTCSSRELIKKEGVYMCPACLTPGENFECAKCGSTDVKLRENID